MNTFHDLFDMFDEITQILSSESQKKNFQFQIIFSVKMSVLYENLKSVSFFSLRWKYYQQHHII